jgi:hypothetical protein
MTWGQMCVRYAPCTGEWCFVSEAEKLKDCDDVTYGSGSAQAEKTKDAGAGYVCVGRQVTAIFEILYQASPNSPRKNIRKTEVA